MLDLTALNKALLSMEQALADTDNEAFMAMLTDAQRNTFIAGVIQNFEFSYELCWKFMKRWLEHNIGSTYVEGLTRRELFRLAAEHRLLCDVDEWMLFHRARNRTSHVYDPVVAAEVHEIASLFLPSAQALQQALVSRND
ncbi:MAG: nucleotidyltransferase substrate binding protein [Marinobacterium sp.]|nr:nucleotidyltransferase substrate binding protein [Marinobacterium sp.]